MWVDSANGAIFLDPVRRHWLPWPCKTLTPQHTWLVFSLFFLYVYLPFHLLIILCSLHRLLFLLLSLTSSVTFAKTRPLPSQSLSCGFFLLIHSHGWVITSKTTSPSLFFQPHSSFMSLLFSQICLFISCLYLKYNPFQEELNISHQPISVTIIIPVIQAEKLASFLTCCSSSSPIILNFFWILNLFILLYTCCHDIDKVSWSTSELLQWLPLLLPCP